MNNLHQAIQLLRGELARVDAAIVQLELLEKGDGYVHVPKQRRGRKSMGADERRQVSERMRQYWAGRRESSK